LKNRQNEPPYRIGGIPAVVQQLVPRLIAGNSQILPEGCEEIEKRLQRQVAVSDRGSKRFEEWEITPVFNREPQIPFKLVELFQSGNASCCLVSDIVGEAAEGVNVIEITTLRVWQE
jgi:hypothetical protein